MGYIISVINVELPVAHQQEEHAVWMDGLVTYTDHALDYGNLCP